MGPPLSDLAGENLSLIEPVDVRGVMRRLAGVEVVGVGASRRNDGSARDGGIAVTSGTRWACVRLTAIGVATRPALIRPGL